MEKSFFRLFIELGGAILANARKDIKYKTKINYFI